MWHGEMLQDYVLDFVISPCWFRQYLFNPTGSQTDAVMYITRERPCFQESC